MNNSSRHLMAVPRVASAETRKKMSDAKKRAWAALSPDDRAAKKERLRLAYKRRQQLYATRAGNLARANSSFSSIDDDFDGDWVS